MRSILSANENAFILKKNGERKGPYKAKFAGRTVVINDASADVSDGDIVIRILPNQKEEHKEILECNFFDSGIGGFGPHFQLKVGAVREKSSSTHSPTSQTINIHGGNVQIGNHNRQEISNSITTLVDIINQSNVSNEQKQEAKNLLQKFIEHPLVVSLAGGAISSLL